MIYLFFICSFSIHKFYTQTIESNSKFTELIDDSTLVFLYPNNNTVPLISITHCINSTICNTYNLKNYEHFSITNGNFSINNINSFPISVNFWIIGSNLCKGDFYVLETTDIMFSNTDKSNFCYFSTPNFLSSTIVLYNDKFSSFTNTFILNHEGLMKNINLENKTTSTFKNPFIIVSSTESFFIGKINFKLSILPSKNVLPKNKCLISKININNNKIPDYYCNSIDNPVFNFWILSFLFILFYCILGFLLHYCEVFNIFEYFGLNKSNNFTELQDVMIKEEENPEIVKL